jgi:glycosyltransferase involved in cell wall biosynthesis
MTNSIAVYYLVNMMKHRAAIKEIAIKQKVDCVVLSNLLPAYTSVRELGKKLPIFFDLSDHFPSSATGYVFNVRSIPGRLSCYALETMLKLVLKKVNCTVACSYPLKNYAENLNPDGKVVMIPNGVEDWFINGHRGETVRNSYGLQGSIVIGYVGMIEFWVKMTPLLQAIKKLGRDYPIKLFLVGKQFQTNTHQKLVRKIKELGISDNVVWSRGWVQREELPQYIAAMDLCSIPFDHTHPTAHFSAPNKLWEYLAVGRPVVSTPLPDILLQAGKCVNFAETWQDYAKIIEDYIKTPENYTDRAKNCSALIKSHTWSKISETYEQLLVDGSIQR